MKLYKYNYKVKEYIKGKETLVKGSIITTDNKQQVLNTLNKKHYSEYTITKVTELN